MLNLEVIYYQGLKKYFPTIHDIEVTIKLKDQKFKGRGTSLDEEEAYLKAFSESIERAATEHYKLSTTNGLAAHSIIEKAKNNAMRELIERDAFMCHHLLSSRLKLLSSDKVSSNSLAEYKLEIKELCRTHLGVGIFVSLTGLEHSPAFGLISGSSFHSDEKIATSSALIEMLREFDYINETKNYSNISIDDFMKISNFTFVNHGQLSKNTSYTIANLQRIEKTNLSLNFCYEKEDFNYIELNLDFISNKIPIKLVQAQNPKLQPLFLGPTTLDKINFNRLSEISKKSVHFEDLNHFPHPFN